MALFPQDDEYFVSADQGMSSCAWQYPTLVSRPLLILRLFPRPDIFCGFAMQRGILGKFISIAPYLL